MNKIEFVRLWDVYSGILTPSRREITDLYLNYDLTVSEIAEQKGITRQAVSDCLNGCKKQFAEYEKKLKFAETAEIYGLRQKLAVEGAMRWAEEFKAAHPEFGGELEALAVVLGKDYSAEAAKAYRDPSADGAGVKK